MGKARRVHSPNRQVVGKDVGFFAFLIGTLTIYYGAEGVRLAVATGKNAIVVGLLSSLVGAILGIVALAFVFIGFEIGAKIISRHTTDQRSKSLRQAQWLLEAATLFLPRKVTGECFGDQVENLEEMAESMPGWRLQLQALISVGWALIFTLRELAKPGALLATIWKLLFGW